MSSVRLSVTFRYRVQIGLNSSKIISRPNSLRSMCSLTLNMGDLVQREHPQKLRLNREGGRKNIKRAVGLKRCKLGPWLVLRTNRKSHTCFRLAPNSSTLDDLEWPKRPPCRSKQKFWRPPQKFQ